MHVWSNYWPCDWIQSLAHLHYLEVSCPKPQPSNHVIDLSSMLGPHPESSHEHKLRYGRDLSWITKNHSGNSKDTVLTSGEEPGTRTRQILYCTTHDIRVLQDLPSAIPPRLTTASSLLWLSVLEHTLLFQNQDFCTCYFLCLHLLSPWSIQWTHLSKPR